MGTEGEGPHAELHVAVQPDLPDARQGAGGVHHVAFRTPDANYDAWAERLNEFGIPNSGKVDRFWFRSLYVREPNGVLFEIATDGPGFAVDEDPAKLGETVVLPPFLEPYRQQILSNLKPIDGRSDWAPGPCGIPPCQCEIDMGANIDRGDRPRSDQDCHGRVGRRHSRQGARH
jgi:hypothetical protein